MKNFNKKGFSLLEVMLAVAIMAITSSMIMYGFMSSMNYANNSSIYARVAAKNEQRNYNQMAGMFYRTDVSGSTGRYADLDSDSDGDKRISLKGGVLDVNVDTRYFYYDDDSASDALTFNVTAGAAALDPVYADALEGTVYRNASVADNRQSFFYTVPDVTFPPGYNMQNGHCPICDEDYMLVMMRRGGESLETGNFHWVCRNWERADHTDYRNQVLANW